MTEIRVEVSDGVAALFLAERLMPGSVLGICGDHAWEVLVEADGRAEDVLDKIAGWLRFQRFVKATVYVDGEPCTVRPN